MYRIMMIGWRAALALALAVTVSTGTADAGSPVKAARATTVREGWPDTPAGIVAAGWVEAFARGEEAMRAYLLTHVSKDALAARPMATRIESYLDLRARLGDLVLSSIETSKPFELTVVLLAEDASRHRFQFKVAGEPPHELLQVGLLRHGGAHGGGHGHGSH